MKDRNTARRSLSNRSCDSTAGFTLLETLVTLMLVSLLALVLSAGVIGSQRLIDTAIGTAASTIKILQLDRYLRRTVGRIVVPYWVGPVKLDTAANALELPYLDGEPELILVLEPRKRGIVVKTPEDPDGRGFGPCGEVAAEPIMRDGTLVGVRVEIEGGRSRRIVTIDAAIGSNPLPEGS